MQHITTLPWIDPLELAGQVASAYEDCVFLYSGIDAGYTGTQSILAYDKKKEVKGRELAALGSVMSDNQAPYMNAWFGYLGYGLKNQLERLPDDAPSTIDMPDLYMMQFGYVLVFDHHAKQVAVWGLDSAWDKHISAGGGIVSVSGIVVSSLQSNMTSQEYLSYVEDIRQHILAGDVYQANLTRKFYGEFEEVPDSYALFATLARVSPAPYSAYLKMDGVAVISSSPERFLHISPEGVVDTRPIKGSAARFSDPVQDAKSKEWLLHSEKDRAENLMIVDLCRNDLSRGCEIGSVNVNNLFDVTSYATVHHMVSTVLGQKRHNVSSLEMVTDCFPPGSMTGAPKIKAMEICSQIEKQRRGIYSGAIGWFGGDGSVDLSVVIRTLIVKDKQFEFQVGGAIVIDSSPESEMEETFIKAKAICQVLGISKESLEEL